MDDLFDVFSEPKAAAPAAAVVLPSTPLQHKQAASIHSLITPGGGGSSKLAPEAFAEFQPQRVVLTSHSDGEKGCISEICFPPNWDEEKEGEKIVPPEKPAKEYPFTLDPFQAQAISCLEKHQSVLVSAHTSAGKTVMAEYAIAMALRDVQRVIYTSPIKALSNQKYRELHEEFEDVGLMTGDITINPSASCLVMTTEILRNMLYRGSEVMREIKWVIFDEIHYMRDKSRGVVWEETLIMLPDSVRMVFLSATIPNASEFAQWVAKLHRQPVNVVYTEYRPTPLQHYIFPAGGEGLHLVLDAQGAFRETNFQTAMAKLQSDPIMGNSAAGGGGGDGEGDGKRKKRRGGKGKSTAGGDLYKIINMIMVKGYAPVIVFAFSKKECEANAMAMTKLDFCDENEKKLIGQIFKNAIDSLSEDDRKLPAVENILPLLKRGIGIHHGGLLPILKEVIEILFQEGLVKCLFATETFAMGLNMPARTVVFSAVSKYDGSKFRTISSGEYTQMAGRAGRRGLDDRGIVIVMADGELEPNECRQMITGKADRLTSAFHLGFNMLLNLLRVDGADPEFMMSRSFHQFQATRSVPELQQKIESLRADQERFRLAPQQEELITDYQNLQQREQALSGKLRSMITQPSRAQQFLNPGRLVRVVDGRTDWGWGAVVNFQTKYPKRHGEHKQDGQGVVVVDVLLRVRGSQKRRHGQAAVSADEAALDDEGSAALEVYRPVPLVPGKVAQKAQKQAAAVALKESEFVVIPVLLPLLDGWSSVRVRLPQRLIGRNERREAGVNMEETLKRFDELPVLDPIADMKVPEQEVGPVLERLQATRAELKNHALVKLPAEEQARLLRAREQWQELQVQVAEVEVKIEEATRDVIMGKELKAMKRVLRRLGYVNADGVIDVKGRVACEISTGNELLATELMFMGAFQELSPDQIAALCSCLICDLQSDNKVEIDARLQQHVRQLMSTAQRIAGVMADAEMTVDQAEFVAQFQPHLIHVVQAWCKGAKFSEICKLTDIFEGTIVRCMRRLEELLRQFASASRSIGNDELAQKFLDSIALLKKDIVFAASLYL